MFGPYPPLAVANEFIRLAALEGGVDHMKLQKLVYYAHGYALSDDDCLVDEQPEAWQYGPVFHSMYFKLKYHGSDLILDYEHGHFDEVLKINRNDLEALSFVKNTWRRLKKYSALQLSEFTHQTGTPWSDVVEKFGGRVPKNYPIPAKAMAKYFRKHDL